MAEPDGRWHRAQHRLQFFGAHAHLVFGQFAFLNILHKGQEKCRSSFAYGGRLTEAMLYGNIALHLNRSLTIDPVTRSILGDEEASALMSGPPARDGWKI